MKKIFFILKKQVSLLFWVLLVSACSPSFTKHTVKVSTLIPPDNNIVFANPNKLALVASLYPDSRLSESINKGIPDDSTLLTEATFLLKDILEESPIFANCDLPVYQIKRMNVDRSSPLQSADLEEIVGNDSVEYLLSVEHISVDTWYESGYAYEPNGDYFSYIQTATPINYIIRLYDIKNKTVANQTIAINKDTIYITRILRGGQSVDLALSQMPDIDEAVFDACQKIANNYVYSIIPYLEESDRSIFIDDKDYQFTRTADLVRDNKWTEAMEIWQNIIGSSEAGSKKIAMACYNMAVACETMGNFLLAKEWLILAEQYNSSFTSSSYKNYLESKIKIKSSMDFFKKLYNF